VSIAPSVFIAGVGVLNPAGYRKHSRGQYPSMKRGHSSSVPGVPKKNGRKRKAPSRSEKGQFNPFFSRSHNCVVFASLYRPRRCRRGASAETTSRSESALSDETDISRRFDSFYFIFLPLPFMQWQCYVRSVLFLLLFSVLIE
jgi:hypothetical protein